MEYAYRVEYKNGKGIYRGYPESKSAKKLYSKLGAAHNYSPTHPSTWTDFSSSDLEAIDCAYGLHGCPSIDAFKEWFRGFCNDFIKCREIVIKKYRYDKIVIGRKQLQCVFEPADEGEVIRGKELDKFRE